MDCLNGKRPEQLSVEDFITLTNMIDPLKRDGETIQTEIIYRNFLLAPFWVAIFRTMEKEFLDNIIEKLRIRMR